MSKRANFEARITSFFQDRLNIDVPASETDLLAEGFLDSMSFVDLLLYLEDEFQMCISLDELDLANFRTVGSISAYIAGRAAYAS